MSKHPSLLFRPAELSQHSEVRFLSHTVPRKFHMALRALPFQAKSPVPSELPEDHCGDQEAPEQQMQDEQETPEAYENG